MCVHNLLQRHASENAYIDILLLVFRTYLLLCFRRTATLTLTLTLKRTQGMSREPWSRQGTYSVLGQLCVGRAQIGVSPYFRHINPWILHMRVVATVLCPFQSNGGGTLKGCASRQGAPRVCGVVKLRVYVGRCHR